MTLRPLLPPQKTRFPSLIPPPPRHPHTSNSRLCHVRHKNISSISDPQRHTRVRTDSPHAVWRKEPTLHGQLEHSTPMCGIYLYMCSCASSRWIMTTFSRGRPNHNSVPARAMTVYCPGRQEKTGVAYYIEYQGVGNTLGNPYSSSHSLVAILRVVTPSPFYAITAQTTMHETGEGGGGGRWACRLSLDIVRTSEPLSAAL